MSVKRTYSTKEVHSSSQPQSKKVKSRAIERQKDARPLQITGHNSTVKDEDSGDREKSDTTDHGNGIYESSAKQNSERKNSDKQKPKGVKRRTAKDHSTHEVPDHVTARESHAKQRALAKERKAAKPHADIIQRSKQLWERLRRKSHVSKAERKQLVDELFSIVNGRVSDFVFKHDAVRVIQCALKYANKTQTTAIADELRGSYRTLAESKYAKFLVGKLLVQG